jgi:hypothetical protein
MLHSETCNYIQTPEHEGLGEFTPSYILHTRAFGTYLLGGLFTLQKKLQGDGFLHVKILKILYVMVFYM